MYSYLEPPFASIFVSWHVGSVLFNTLVSKLQAVQGYESEDRQSVEGIQKAFLTRYLTESQQFGTPVEDVKEKLCDLQYLTTESVYQWSLKKIKDLSFKDTTYHASICCQALTYCTAGDYQKFFKDTQRVPGHSLQAISISCPTPDGKQHERYLIAKQGESKYYIAFESQPVLSQWPKKCNSFIEG